MKQPSRRNGAQQRGVRVLLVAILVLAFASLACSVGDTLVGRSQVAAPTPTKTPRPTFTPLPTIAAGLAAPTQGVRGVLPPGVTVQAPRAENPAVPITGSLSHFGDAGRWRDRGGQHRAVRHRDTTAEPNARTGWADA